MCDKCHNYPEKTIDEVAEYYNELSQWHGKVEVNEIEVEAEEVLSKHAKRKAQPVFSGVLSYFPDAIKYIGYVSKVGNDQHNPNKPLHWDRSKSQDEPDALVRHLIDHSVDPMDDDGILHAGKVAWRALALLQKHLEKNPQ
jgi:hypothetical protein